MTTSRLGRVLNSEPRTAWIYIATFSLHSSSPLFTCQRRGRWFFSPYGIAAWATSLRKKFPLFWNHRTVLVNRFQQVKGIATSGEFFSFHFDNSSRVFVWRRKVKFTFQIQRVPVVSFFKLVYPPSFAFWQHNTPLLTHSRDWKESFISNSIMEENGCFSFQIFFLKTSAVWPLQTKNIILQILNKFYITFICTLLTIVSLSLIAATLFSRDLKNISSTVDIATLTISALYKFGFTKIHIKRFKYVVSFANTKFKKFISNKNGQMISVEFENTRSNLYSFLLVLSGFVAAMFWGVFPAFEDVEYEESDNSTRVMKKKFPLACWLPFNASWSPLYEIIYALEAISFFLGAHIYLTKDAFFFMMIYQICIQMKMLSMMIMNIETDRDDYTNKCITFDETGRSKCLFFLPTNR